MSCCPTDQNSRGCNPHIRIPELTDFRVFTFPAQSESVNTTAALGGSWKQYRKTKSSVPRR